MASQDQTTPLQGTGPVDQRLATSSILDTARSHASLERFVDAVERCGMTGVLMGVDVFTVFAPGDEAMAAVDLPEGEDLRNLLLRQVVRTRIAAVELKRANSLKTLAGIAIPVEANPDGMRFGGGLIVEPDIPCTNGVLHIVDGMAEAGKQA